jgi:hypothetical protein
MGSLDWRRSYSVLFALGLISSGCASGAAAPESHSEGSAHGDEDGGATADDSPSDDQVATDDESGDDAPVDDAEPTDDDDAQPQLDAGGDDTSADDTSADDGWNPTDSSDDSSDDTSDGSDGSDGDGGTPNPDGCLTLAPNSPSSNFNTVDAVCFSVAAMPATAWEVYRLGGRTIKVDGTTVTAGELPWPGSAPFVVEFSAGSDSTTAWAYW